MTSPNSSDHHLFKKIILTLEMVLKIVVDLEDLVFWCIEENLVYFWEENRHSKGWEAV